MSQRLPNARASQPDELGPRSQGCLWARRREATTRQNSQDAFHRKCPERRPPWGGVTPRGATSRDPTKSEVRLASRQRTPFCDSRLMLTEVRMRCSLRASPCPRASTVRDGDVRHTHRRGRSRTSDFCRTFSTHGHTHTSPRSFSALGCRLRPRSSPKTQLSPSSRGRPERDQRPSEKPCPLTMLPSADLSAVALAKLHSRASALPKRRLPANEPGVQRSVTVTSRHATWVAPPK